MFDLLHWFYLVIQTSLPMLQYWEVYWSEVSQIYPCGLFPGTNARMLFMLRSIYKLCLFVIQGKLEIIYEYFQSPQVWLQR